VTIKPISGINLTFCFNLVFVTEQYEVDYRQMTGSSVYSNMKPSCLHTKVKIMTQLMENTKRHGQETGSESRPLAGFGIKGVEASGSATVELLN